mgnify:CR=1 FL=1
MSLRIYTHRKDVPNGMSIIDKNDEYFAAYTKIASNAVVSQIIRVSDDAVRASDTSYFSRISPDAAITKDNLSTGAKTLLNVLEHKDTCFSLLECGNNILNALHLVTDGNALWETPSIMLEHRDMPCDAIVGQKHFTNFSLLIMYLYYGEECYTDYVGNNRR